MGVANKKRASNIQSAVRYVNSALERDKNSASARLFNDQILELEEKKTSGVLSPTDFKSYQAEIRKVEKNRTNTYLRDKLTRAAEKYHVSVDQIVRIGSFADIR